MAALVVLYTKPADVEGFDASYRSTHVPLAEKVPGATWTFTRFTGNARGGEPLYYLMARAEFADEAALQAGLASPEMREAGADAAQMVRQFGNEAVRLVGADDR